MTLGTLWKLWRKFWFAPESPVTSAVPRIVFGLLLLQFGVLLAPETHVLLGERTVLPRIPDNAWWKAPAFSILDYLPRTDFTLDCLMAVFMVAAALLTLGLWTRVSAFVIWLIMASFYARNAFAFGASDSILRTVALLLAFSHADDALSLKRIFDVWFSKTCPSGPPTPVKPWALRMIQVHFALVWWVGCTRKMHGEDWMNGNAVYYVTHVSELARYPIPLLPDNLWTSKFLTWSTMLVEFSLAILIWFRELRLPLILIGIFFHLGMDWALWVPQFEFTMIAGLITFLEPSTYSQISRAVRSAARRIGMTPATVLYNPGSDLSCRLAETARRLDLLKLLDVKERESVTADVGESAVPAGHGLFVSANNGWQSGVKAMLALSGRLPALMILYPFLLLPGAEGIVGAVRQVLCRNYIKGAAE